MILKPLSPTEIRGDTKLLHWYLIFTDVHSPHWWDRWLKPQYRHCYAARQVGDHWLVVNPRTDYTQIAIEAGYRHNSMNLLQVSDGEPISVVSVIAMVPKNRLRSRWFVGPVTCVETIKGLLGLRAFWVFTPWQLYRYVRSCRGTIQKAKDTGPYRPGSER